MASNERHAPNAVETILDTRTVTPEYVLDLRRKVWPDGIVSRREAELLFEVNDTLETVCGEWRDFFAEAMVAHLIGQADPKGYISKNDAEWFRERVLRDGKIAGETELETLIQLLEKATDAPVTLEILAIEAVRDAVLAGDHAVLGNAALVPGTLDDPEVALLRRVLYAKAAGRSEAIGREEAELLFDLNDATADADNAPAWTALFVNGIANYLLVHSGYEPPSRERLKRVDHWLNQPAEGVGSFMGAMAKGLGHGTTVKEGLADIGRATRSVRLFGTDTPMQELYRRRSRVEAVAREDAEQVDAGEAAWLVQRIERDRALTVNERALLTFLKESDLTLDPALDPLFTRM